MKIINLKLFMSSEITYREYEDFIKNLVWYSLYEKLKKPLLSSYYTMAIKP